LGKERGLIAVTDDLLRAAMPYEYAADSENGGIKPEREKKTYMYGFLYIGLNA
jgi:hypothetical protein